MFSLPTLAFAAAFFCLVPVLFAAYFFYMFRRDKDKRKLMVTIAFVFFACSFLPFIFPSPSLFYFGGNLFAWGTLPILIAVLIILTCDIVQIKTFEKTFKLFLSSLIIALLLFFIPVNLETAGTLITDFLAFFALMLSLFVFIKKRQLGNVLLLLSLVSFLAYGLGLEVDVGFAFIFLSYTFGFIFIGLAFTFTSTDKESGASSIFKVTEHLDETKQRLRELELEYKTIFESANDSIFVINAETNLIVDCNLEATKLIEREKQDIIGKDQKKLFLGQKTEGSLTQVSEDKNPEASKPIEMQVVTGKGEVKDVAIKWGTFQHGSKKLLVGVFRDITEQKKTAADLAIALESLSSNLDRNQILNEKLRVVGSLTRHDVRNKLSVVTGYSYILKKKHTDETDVVEGLDKMVQSVKEVEKIFEFAKVYEQLGSEELMLIDVSKTLDEATALFSGSIPKIINDCHGLTVLADSFLRQMFYNFVDNTRKYGKKTTTIKIYHEKTDEGYLKLIYEDDGVGISVENKQQLFKEGFSTGGSTGFGLFLIKKMMDVYGWTIEETGEPGKGVKFIITIPEKNKNGRNNFFIAPNDDSQTQ